MEQETAAQIRTLPELRLLKISNLTTFPMDLELRPTTGVNVVFGGNYSGKTTLVNAIKFGIFGLTLNRTDEELSARYFASRIREQERKSLDIVTSFGLGRNLVTVKRTMFSSGPQRLDVQIVDPEATPGGAVIGSFSTSHDYLASLCEMMGLDDLKDVEFVLQLLLADEDRNTVLWREDCEKMTMKLLMPGQEYVQLNWLDREIDKKKGETTSVSKALQALSDRLDRQHTVIQFLQSGSEKLRLDRPEETVRKVHDLRSKRDSLQLHLQQLRQEMGSVLDDKSKKLNELSGLQSSKDETTAKIDSLKLEKYKAIMHSDEPEGVHIVKHLIHEKRCPYCDSDLSAAITERESHRLCIFCGHEIGAPRARGIEELNRAIAEEEQNALRLREVTSQLVANIVEIDTKIGQLEDEIKTEQQSETETAHQLGQLKETEDVESQLKVLERELGFAKARISEDTQEFDRLSSSLSKLKAELAEIQELHRKGREIARAKMKEVFGRMSMMFAQFIRESTNGEIVAELSLDMVPSLNGRRIYSADDVSQFERTIMDIAFRIAVISCLVKDSESRPLLVFETPDDIADESYLRHLAEAFFRFGKDVSILITSSSTPFVDSLMKGYDSSERRRRLLDLSVSGTTTQKSYYSPFITEWIR